MSNPAACCNYSAPGVRVYSVAWYAGHEAHHLATYPDLDQVSRDNLAEATARAKAAQGETFGVTVIAADEADAAERVARVIDRSCPGQLCPTGVTGVKSARHALYTVEVEALAPLDRAARNDLWVVLTSYGLSPSTDLGSTWEAVLVP